MTHICKNCDEPTSNTNDICGECYRNPETNNCSDCGKHLIGICYEYVCGDCVGLNEK